MSGDGLHAFKDGMEDMEIAGKEVETGFPCLESAFARMEVGLHVIFECLALGLCI